MLSFFTWNKTQTNYLKEASEDILCHIIGFLDIKSTLVASVLDKRMQAVISQVLIHKKVENAHEYHELTKCRLKETKSTRIDNSFSSPLRFTGVMNVNTQDDEKYTTEQSFRFYIVEQPSRLEIYKQTTPPPQLYKTINLNNFYSFAKCYQINNIVCILWKNNINPDNSDRLCFCDITVPSGNNKDLVDPFEDSAISSIKNTLKDVYKINESLIFYSEESAYAFTMNSKNKLIKVWEHHFHETICQFSSSSPHNGDTLAVPTRRNIYLINTQKWELENTIVGHFKSSDYFLFHNHIICFAKEILSGLSQITLINREDLSDQKAIKWEVENEVSDITFEFNGKSLSVKVATYISNWFNTRHFCTEYTSIPLRNSLKLMVVKYVGNKFAAIFKKS